MQKPQRSIKDIDRTIHNSLLDLNRFISIKALLDHLDIPVAVIMPQEIVDGS